MEISFTNLSILQNHLGSSYGQESFIGTIDTRHGLILVLASVSQMDIAALGAEFGSSTAWPTASSVHQYAV